MRRNGLAFGLLLGLLVAKAASAGLGFWSAAPSSFSDSVVVDSAGAVYADCETYDVCKSLDHGVSWQLLSRPGPSDPLVFSPTRVLAVDAAGAVYVAVESGRSGTTVSTLYVSRDGGETWTALIQETGPEYVGLRVDPFLAGTIYLMSGSPSAFGFGVTGPGVLRRSSDEGVHWSRIDEGFGASSEQPLSGFTTDPSTPGRVYAANVVISPGAAPSSRLLMSNDRGSTWAELAAKTPGIFVSLVVDPFSTSIIYGGGPSGTFRSDDGGKTFVESHGARTSYMVTDPSEPARLFLGLTASGVEISSDRGARWTQIYAGLTDLAIKGLALDAARGYLYAATRSGLFVYQLPGPEVLVLHILHPFSITLTATDQRTGRTGSGVATQVNDLWGYFSIPAITNNPNNPEVFVKMLDGTALNGSYWFFYGGLTDLEYTLTVTEDATGLTKTYTKPAGSECGGSDTAAFGP